jgi:ribonuclease T2
MRACPLFLVRILVPLLAGAACEPRTSAPPTPVAPPASVPAPATSPGSEFGLYLLSMTWEPNRCCTERDHQQCSQLPGSFAATHLTLHGLWPNYTDEQSRGKPRAWPQYCGAYQHCDSREDASCAPGVAVPQELARLAPGYVAGTGGFATHEWSKHGSCTRLSAAEYFGAELAAIRAIPGDATPDALSAAVGADLGRDALQRAFGVPPDSVMLGCDAHCRLARVGFCLAKDAGDHPTTPITCTANVATSDYDNGCVTHGCERVVVQAAGACDTR